ncbi:MAG TPA: phosphate starvation-inducible protein PhoH, partial [Bacillota bacterium]|nr:phosphate starvation-inducible protein PhoH [Bacillota bacterium]
MSDSLQAIDLHLANPNEALNLFGANDKHLKILEEKLNISIVTRGEEISVSGSDKDITYVQD